MAIDQQLFDFMPHVVTIHSVSSTNSYGETVWGATRSAAAYVEPMVRLSGTNMVDETHAPTRAYIADTAIVMGEKIVLPDGRAPDIAAIEVHTVVEGLEHTVVTFL